MEWNFLSAAGAVFLGYYSLNLFLQIVHGIRAFVLPALGVRKNLRKLGEWAGKGSMARSIAQSSVRYLRFLVIANFSSSFPR